MRSISSSRWCALLNKRVAYLLPLTLLSLPALAQVTITSPAPGSTSISAVRIAASSIENGSYHLEVWDNGNKLGNVFASNVNDVYVLPNGSHNLAVNAVSNSGTFLNGKSISYTVAENCDTATSQCDLDRQPANNTQNDCPPPSSHTYWLADACGSGIQGTQGAAPLNTGVASAIETGTIPDIGNNTLNGQSLHLSETQRSTPIQGQKNAGYSNVLFAVSSPQPAPQKTVQSHWTLDEYVYLPNPLAHQAFEMDAQYVVDSGTTGVWTKFYTECQFNTGGTYGTDASTGYWAVYDNNTGGWIVLNGVAQKNSNGVVQTPPAVPCNREQFAEPWQFSASSAPAFSGWHHVVWTFLRNGDGTVTFETLTFDATTYPVNFSPASGPGGTGETNYGDFGTLIQLDGADNSSGKYDTVEVYVNELNVTHTQ